MKKGLTEIVCIIDRSGSMGSIKGDMEGGFNSFIERQKKEPGEARVTLAQFDTEYELLYEAVPIGEVKKFELVPRGGTALLDAIGRTVNSVGERLAKTTESERPERVIVCVVTDGYENSSREFTSDSVKKMIKEQEEKYAWKFLYLGANQDAFAEGAKMGFRAEQTANIVADNVGVKCTFDAFNTYTSSYRSGKSDIKLKNEDSRV